MVLHGLLCACGMWYLKEEILFALCGWGNFCSFSFSFSCIFLFCRGRDDVTVISSISTVDVTVTAGGGAAGDVMPCRTKAAAWRRGGGFAAAAGVDFSFLFLFSLSLAVFER